jgi:ADP-ribose pyrophosphatase YjhB (NUDIX family)
MMASERKLPAVHVSVAVMDGERLLLVREEKEALRGRWNLPGGHLEVGETVLAGAARELVEETGIVAKPESLVGIYSTAGAHCFVFRVTYAGQAFLAGDEILEARFVGLSELEGWGDEVLVGPALRRRIFADLKSGVGYSLEAFVGVGV